ncbi:MAG: carboxypeptidase M32 [Acidocella sp.]|nr:carboxypeptidase M32 [Acidocella sp.]
MTAYERLRAAFGRIATLNEAAAVLGWDASAMMPDGGAEARGEQVAVLAGLAHELLTAPQVAEDFAAATAPAAPWEAANFALMQEAHKRATALPQDLVEAVSRANSHCETIWRTARQTSDFALVQAPLTEVVNLARESAEILGAALGVSPYDALLASFQRGVTAADVTPVFAEYAAFLQTALPAAEARQLANPAPAMPPGPYPEAMQETLCQHLSEAAGLDYTHARLDRSAHPFCGGTPTDVRITNRYDEADVCAALMGALHETGHGIYEQNLPAAYRRQPVGEAAGSAVHESQSLIIEMQAVRTDAYLSYLAPVLSRTFARDISAAALKSRLRHVERSFIRVEADEMTYPAHVLLRFRLEQALMAGDLAVADLPGAWNEGFHALLGITPPDDRRGCLQDIHWHCGLFGYFPTYTLGAMAAAQLMAAARRAIPGLDAAFGKGDLSPLRFWLNENVHHYGASLGFNELLCHATGEALNPKAFEAHLTARYLG